MCIKNLRILTLYFPAFGLLFDTIKKAKTNLAFTIIMFGMFLMAYMFGGNILFGNKCELFSTVGSSGTSLFRMLFGEFFFTEMQ